ncbi:MAG: branched chain amino acid aminotransferase [Candidatus Marinimicrobia bacterium CG08_land_8_20_14_0_20_45_22]|nr:MAG: branched chain amino acid aminotransferase [Candidatus Marinimicrobia bacterium CG08_land_8_20_14_0_20_45_22]
MDPKATEWSKLDFSYRYTPYRFHAHWKDGSWNEGILTSENKIAIDEGATCLHYGQQIFEGMKAQRAKDGRILLFRPRENAKRFRKSARRLLMAEVPEELFMKGIISAVKANIDYIPPYGTGASLYLRPFQIGIGENLGVHPALEYLFVVFVSPVGPYFKAGFKPISLKVESFYDRAALHGIGQAKAGGNYSASLLPLKIARDEGFNEVVYLDPLEHKYFEETGASNVFFVFKDGSVATPKSDTILDSITRHSLIDVVREDFGLKMEERPISVSEIDNFAEVGACGTATVITPVGCLSYLGKLYNFYADGKEPGPITTRIYKQLTGIQIGDIPDKRGWLEEVK